jgi:hypothetical protein
MRPAKAPLLFLFALASAVAGLEANSPIIREAGVIYLSDFEKDPLRLKVKRAAPCYFDIGMTRYAGTLRYPQEVRVEAFVDNACRIRGNAQQGGVAAWIPVDELEPLPENFLANLQKAEERRIQVNELIANNEVAIGMTEPEVSQSLGRPQKKSKRADKSGAQQVWEYIRYELVPQTVYAPGVNQTVITQPGIPGKPGGTVVQTSTGLTAATTYVKVPVGKLAVTFQDGIVESLDQTEGTLTGGQVSIVVPPIDVY